MRRRELLGYDVVTFRFEGSEVECDSPASVEMFLQGLHAFNERQRAEVEAKSRSEESKRGRPITTNIAESKIARRQKLLCDSFRFLLLLREKGGLGATTEEVMKAVEISDSQGLGGTIAAINALFVECQIEPSTVYRSINQIGQKTWFKSHRTGDAIAAICDLYREEFGVEHPLNVEEISQADFDESVERHFGVVRTPNERISREDEIRNLLQKNGPLTRAEVAEKTGFPVGTINANLTSKNFVQLDDGRWSAESPE